MNLFTHLLIYNLAASILVYGSLAYNPRIWLHRMPPEVRRKVPEKTPEERKLFIGIALPFVLLLFVYPVVYVAREGTTLLVCIGMLFAFFVSFALWDTLVLDLLIFCKVTPRFVIIMGQAARIILTGSITSSAAQRDWPCRQCFQGCLDSLLRY